MHTKTSLLAVAAIALLAGCNRGAANNSAAANATASANTAAPAAPAAPVPAPAPGGANGPVDQAFVTGHWGGGGNCAQTISFNADGTATATGENDPIRWSLEGNTMITIENEDPPERVTVARGGDRLVVTQRTGEITELTRCPAAAANPSPSGSN